MSELDSLRRTIKGVDFPYPIMIAGGIVKTAEKVRELAETDVVAEWGSITTKPSDGNGGQDYHAEYLSHRNEEPHLFYTQNSLGLPNPGMDYVERHARDLIKLYRDCGKPLVLNVSGNGVEDSLTLLKRGLESGFPVVTLNGACPNKKDQPILCDDADAVDELFERADSEIGSIDQVVFWKVSCGMRRPALAHNRKRVNESKVFTGSITCNTVPNGLDFDEHGRAVIKTGNGIDRGGLAGPAILPIALDHTQFMASDCPHGKVVIGCGGIQYAKDALKYFRVNATLIQVNSAYREAGENPDFVQWFIEDLLQLQARA